MTILGSERWVIVCGWVGGGAAFLDLKEINARYGSGFGGIESFQLSASSSTLLHRGLFRFGWVSGERRIRRNWAAKGGSLSADGLVAVRHLSI